MGRFMDEARYSAAREFGARHYRWFAFWHYARGAVPVVAGLITLAGLVLAGAWVAKRWDAAVWPVVAAWGPTTLWWAGAALLAAVVLAIGVVVWRRVAWRMSPRLGLGWRWSLRNRW